MNWGQLRFQIRQTFPDASLDLIEEWINTRYEQVLAATDWIGLRAHSILQTTAAHLSGADTVMLTVGLASVQVTGATWTEAAIWKRFYRKGDSTVYTVAAVGSGYLTLDRPYEGNGSMTAGTVLSAQGYVLMQNIYALPDDCRNVVAIMNPETFLPLQSISKRDLDAITGTRATTGSPARFSIYDDTADGIHQVELYPPPQYERGLEVEYMRAAPGFDGTNLEDSPMPFISSAVMLHGVRADAAVAFGNDGKVAFHEAKFQEELGRLLRVEHQHRREQTGFSVDARYTRHRGRRAGSILHF